MAEEEEEEQEQEQEEEEEEGVRSELLGSYPPTLS